MGSLKPQPFIEAMRIDTGIVRCQLDDMRATLPGALHGPLHHRATDSLTLKLLIHPHRFHLCPQPSLKAERGQKHQMKRSDYFPISFGDNQLVIWVVLDLLESGIIRLRQWV